ncbi:hypothetical protein [Gracilinema caldarium]|uniref:Uncharacterized protein n=1 Tax=Gracilinema caldarium (strain ATCC 51460 / DSM 7334 / H1) TaxID=744872 RepID=F8F432_GRAC1|nr:hypothetical protein [Gracilinema caldarium]AEJ20051.1 hypothetical protein Spica_1919 [Gracilinema caldarium DSM 7334]
MFQPEHLTEEINLLEDEHEKRFNFPANLMFAPDDPVLVAKRLRQALAEGVPWDTDKEWYESLPQWFREQYDKGEILI